MSATTAEPRPFRKASESLPDEPESPLARLTPEQIEQLGREFDAIHDEVYADLGERDSRYIRSTIKLHRQLVLSARALLHQNVFPGGIDSVIDLNDAVAFFDASFGCSAVRNHIADGW